MARTNECLGSRMDKVAKTKVNGVLIYAFNNSRINYFRQAVWCADRVNKFLNLPVTIVTDTDSAKTGSCSHNIIYTVANSGGTRVYSPTVSTRGDTWFNGNRYQSFDLSPYDQTLVIDSDYIVCSNQLLTLFHSNINVTAMKNVYDVTNRDQFRQYRFISTTQSLHHYWATVLYFNKSAMSRDFFNIVTMIRENYRHYSELYQFSATPFRNDFAVSIALNTLYGHVPNAVPVVPWSMANVFSDVDIFTNDQVNFDLTYQLDNKPRRVTITGQDFHFMNKNSLEKLYEY
jgi:hypothetical protein